MTGTKEKGRQPLQGLATRVFNESNENRNDLPMIRHQDQRRAALAQQATAGTAR